MGVVITTVVPSMSLMFCVRVVIFLSPVLVAFVLFLLHVISLFECLPAGLIAVLSGTRTVIMRLVTLIFKSEVQHSPCFIRPDFYQKMKPEYR